jgi:peptidoglycan/xylan/chitin deacetylase (PgdA/CDA1 family)
LSVSQDYLDFYIKTKKREGWRFISIDEFYADFASLTEKGKHMIITLDDGYRDNFTRGLPVFDSNNVPFILYVSNCFPNGTADLWWEKFSVLAKENKCIKVCNEEFNITIEEKSPLERYKFLSNYFLGLDPHKQFRLQIEIERRYEHGNFLKSELLTWDDIISMAKSPLCTLGAHTMSHKNLRFVDDEVALTEIVESKRELEKNIGMKVSHFAYPYGKNSQITKRDLDYVRDAGFLTAVTTNIGNVFYEHKDFMHFLPRFPIYEQSNLKKMSEIYLSGMHGALTNQLRRVIPLGN